MKERKPHECVDVCVCERVCMSRFWMDPKIMYNV